MVAHLSDNERDIDPKVLSQRFCDISHLSRPLRSIFRIGIRLSLMEKDSLQLSIAAGFPGTSDSLIVQRREFLPVHEEIIISLFGRYPRSSRSPQTGRCPAPCIHDKQDLPAGMLMYRPSERPADIHLLQRESLPDRGKSVQRFGSGDDLIPVIKNEYALHHRSVVREEPAPSSHVRLPYQEEYIELIVFRSLSIHCIRHGPRRKRQNRHQPDLQAQI